MKRYYFDYNSTTPLLPEVENALKKALRVFGNPSSHHDYGQIAKEAIEDARAAIARLIHADHEQLVFTSSGSEANNHVIKSIVFDALAHKSPSHIITSNIEHPCVIEACKFAEELGTDVSYIGVDKQGLINIHELKAAFRDDTKLVSIMTANNETGTIQDIHTLSSIAHEHHALFHTDATQAVGKIPINVNEWNVDFMSLSGHKMGGPKGVAALYIKNDSTINPIIHGGPQERKRRAGTENVLGIIGFGEAATTQLKHINKTIKHEKALLTDLKNELSKLPYTHINSHPEKCLPNTLNVSFEGVDAESLVIRLDVEGIAVSTGSACSSGSTDPSYVLEAMNVNSDRIQSAIRISIGPDTTANDISHLGSVLTTLTQKMRTPS